MSQRNPMNQRYRDTERTGKSRKSAASAKPVAKAAASVHVKTVDPKEKKRAQKAQQREREQRANSVPVEYVGREKFWRKIWWVTLGGAVGCLAVSWFAGYISAEYYQQLTVGFMIAAYVFLAAMIFIDIKFVRPARLRAREKGLRGYSKKERKEIAAREEAEAAYRKEHPTIAMRLKNYFMSDTSKKKAKKAAAKNADKIDELDAMISEAQEESAKGGAGNGAGNGAASDKSKK